MSIVGSPGNRLLVHDDQLRPADALCHLLTHLEGSKRECGLMDHESGHSYVPDDCPAAIREPVGHSADVVPGKVTIQVGIAENIRRKNYRRTVACR
jgi:hypothetical protein